jgi:hypothetical protein
MSAIYCPEALRTIGDDLELRGIKTFLIRCEGDRAVVEGGYQSPPAPTPVTLQYGLDDIEYLDRRARERNYLSSANDFLSSSKILWALASYVTAKGGRLHLVSNNDGIEKMPAVKIEYETSQRKRVVEDLKGSAIYELCVGVYKLRKTSRIDNNQHTLFSALPDPC